MYITQFLGCLLRRPCVVISADSIKTANYIFGALNFV